MTPEEQQKYDEVKKKYEEERKEAIDKMNAQTKEELSRRYLLREKEEKRKEELMPALKKKKEMLASLRDLHKTPNHEQFMLRREKLNNDVREMTDKMKSARLETYDKNRKDYQEKMRNYQSQFTKAIQEYDVQ